MKKTKEELKTLKDIKKEYEDELTIDDHSSPIIYIKCGKCGNTNNFEWENDEEFIEWYHNRLRQVAKDWIKIFDEGNLKKCDKIFGKDKTTTNMCIGAMLAFEHFFNLEE